MNNVPNYLNCRSLLKGITLGVGTMRHPFVVLFLLAMALNFGRAQDTIKLKELSAEDARRLAQDRSGRLLLNGLTTLSPEAAKELARFDGWLSLNGLASLSDEVADALGQHKGHLHLDGLTKIADAAAKALARHNGELSLKRLTSLSDEAATALAKHSGGRLYLNGVKALSTDAAKALAQRKGGGPSNKVCLDGLESLTALGAAALAESHGHNWDGRLPAMKTIPEDVARALAKRQGGLSLEGLTSLSDESAKALGGKLGGSFPRLTSLSVEAAKAIVGPNRTLVLDGLTALPDNIATVIAGKNSSGDLHLGGLTTLTPFAAKEISQRNGDLYLNGLTTISNDVLKALAEHKSGGNSRPLVYLKGLTTISDEGAAILASWPKWCGELPALTTLSEKSAIPLASSRKWNGNLPSLKTISPEAARALAQRQGNLSFDGLTTLSEEAAKEMAKHRGGTLSLNGLKELSDNSAFAFSEHNGRLSLNGLTALSKGAAASLGKHKGDWLFLDGLTTLSEDAAKSLAQHKSVVSLSGLMPLTEEAFLVLTRNPKMALPENYRARPAFAKPQAADVKSVSEFLEANCMSCHSGKRKEGDFSMDALAFDNIAGRVAYASILERLRAGDMPPSVKARPDPAESAGVVQWISSQLDAPFKGPATHYAVKEKPVDGNRLPHAILFGGPRSPSVPPPPRLWRLSPSAYTKSLSGLNVNGLQQPFGLIQDSGFRDFSALYAPDEGATSLLLTNAEQVVLAQVRPYTLVNLVAKPESAKESLWPSEARIKTATPEERKHLEKGDRVRGNGIFAALMHPKVAANREELVKAIEQQYRTILARQPNAKELESLLELYKDVAKEGDYSLAGKTILMAPLMTPEAILRFEVGLGAEVRTGVRMLSPRETAFALSLALSDNRDLNLLSAAAQGKLTTRAEVVSAVKNILDDPKLGKPRVLRFFREYFDYYRATEVFKDPIPDHLKRQGVSFNARQFIDDTDVLVLSILSHDKDVFKEMLTTTDSYRTHELFGASEDGLRNGHGPLFRKFSPFAMEHRRPQSENIGIPMQPSWLVAWSVGTDNDIVRRGRWVREKLIGGRVPDLPINVQAMVPEDPHRTLRDRQMVTRANACWKCHYRMDDLGTPFEHVNHYGFVRATEPVIDLEALKSVKDKKTRIYRDAPLDTTGFILHSGDPKLDGPVKDAPEMLRRLAESERVRQVFIRHAFRFFLGRNETPGDAPTLQEADRAYLESGGSFKALLVSLLSSESFLYRTVPSITKDK
ncbi:MAG: DUF1588 domain-containing protein [Planctomycetes bacterium]|nr:DUF1588 domain-containing protein [Planctomycetota bacterium]